MKPLGIYVHIPFCVKKCGYCDFNSVVLNDPKQIKSYLLALLADIQLSSKLKQDYMVESIYIGGGTPSLLDAQDIAAIISSIKQCFQVIDGPEIAIEVNPNSVSKQKLLVYKQCGINRVSMGVQSFKDKNLAVLGRAHSSLDVFKALEMLENHGFDNVSIDLIYGLPNQSINDWEADLRAFIDCDLSHISLYDLKIEKGTPFYKIKDSFKVADNDLQALMYKRAHELLSENGFKHYEISSFSKKGRQSKHNLLYWHNSEYLGVGAGAYSYISGERFCKVRDIQVYQTQANEGRFEHNESEVLSPGELMGETLMLNLRLLDGFNIKEIEKKLNNKVDDSIISALNEFTRQGFILYTDNIYKLTHNGLLHYDTIASELLS